MLIKMTSLFEAVSKFSFLRGAHREVSDSFIHSFKKSNWSIQKIGAEKAQQLVQQLGGCKYNVLKPTFTSGNTYNSMTRVSAIMCLVLRTAKISAVIITINNTNPYWGFQVPSNWGYWP